jgi:hypothetical protein
MPIPSADSIAFVGNATIRLDDGTLLNGIPSY